MRLQPADEPWLAVVVVGDEHAVRLQDAPDVLERLAREQKALQTDARETRVQDQRVDERVDDEVVPSVRPAHEAAAIVDVHGDARIRVRLVRMIAPAQIVDGRIDLHGVDMLHAVTKRGGDVVSGPGADDQHVGEGSTAGIAVQQVRQRVGRSGLVDVRPSPDARCCWSQSGATPGSRGSCSRATRSSAKSAWRWPPGPAARERRSRRQICSSVHRGRK